MGETSPACLCAQARWELSCSLCEQAYGACIQCAGSQACVTAFHPLCARAARLRMAAVPDFSADSDSDDTAEQDANPKPDPDADLRLPDAHAAGSADLGGCGGRADGVESAGGAPLGGLAGRRAKRRRHAPQPGGTALADGRRLVCFCARHAAADTNPAPYGPGASAGGAGGAGQGVRQGVGAGGACAGSRADCAGAAAAATGRPPCASGTLEGCSRTHPFDHALRRGARAPEALAAALAKRSFVRARPYVVSTARHGAAPPPSRCFRVVAPSAGGSCDLTCAVSGSKAKPQVVCSAARVPLREVLGPCVPGAAGADPAGSGQPAPTTLAALLQGLQQALSGRATLPGAAEAGPQVDAPALAGPCAGERGVLSLAERMAAMRRTLARRVTCGATQPQRACNLATSLPCQPYKGVWLAVAVVFTLHSLADVRPCDLARMLVPSLLRNDMRVIIFVLHMIRIAS